MASKLGLASLMASLLVCLTAMPAAPAWAGDATATPSAPPSAEPTPTPTTTPTPTPPPPPPPECRGVKDTRTGAARKRAFVVCGVVVISKSHRVTTSYRPSLVRVSIRLSGIRATRLQPEAATALKSLFAGAAKAGHKLAVRSGYRSYATQRAAYRPGRTLTAPPGASEHQSGLAVDLAVVTKSGLVRGYGFGRSKAGRWVAAHAAEYGFVIRYPSGQKKVTEFSYEPWHLRFVGTQTASGVTQTKTKTLERYLRIS